MMLPMDNDISVGPLSREAFPEAREVIVSSFATVAEEFGLTRENAPSNAAFLTLETMRGWDPDRVSSFGAWSGGRLSGFAALERAANGAFYLEKLAVLPEVRHRGLGRRLVDRVAAAVIAEGGSALGIGIINENSRLKVWYLRLGFEETGIRKFDHLPFTVCFMKKKLKDETP